MTRREEIRTQMDDLSAALQRSIAAEPDHYDDREPLWMAREDLREELSTLEAPCPAAARWFGFTGLGPTVRPAFGAYCSLLLVVPA